MESFFVVGEKLLIMGVMIAVGCIVSKLGRLSEKTINELTWILLNIVTPCVIVHSFSKIETGSLSTQNMILCVIISVLTFASGGILCHFLYKKEEPAQQKVFRFSMTFSNASFMGIPLTQSILGNDGVVYASIFVALFNLVLWTFGFTLMSGQKKLSIKKILLNCGTIGFTFGIILYYTQFQLPEVIYAPLEGIAQLNTPLAMFIFGYFISSIKMREIFLDKQIYFASFLRLIAMPSLIVLVMIFIKPPETLFLSTSIQACAPAATTTVLFSALFNADAKLASKIVTATNLLCLITIPIFVSLVQILVNQIL